jgi:two-component system chemotaxis response regulator CheY
MRFSMIAPELRPDRLGLIRLISSIFPEDVAGAQLYFLADGDVVGMLDCVTGKQLRQLAALLPPGSEYYLKLHELQNQLNQLMVGVQAKLDADAARREAKRLRSEHSMRERRRQHVLNYPITDLDKNRIRSVRGKRTQRELMIVEDDTFSRRLLENILPKQHHITSVGDPELAIERYLLMVPDILFLDIDLPGVNGHELLEKILSFDPDAYIIMISGNSDRDNVVRAMSHGARGFIAKPFSRERIHEYLQRCPTIK